MFHMNPDFNTMQFVLYDEIDRFSIVLELLLLLNLLKNIKLD